MIAAPAAISIALEGDRRLPQGSYKDDAIPSVAPESYANGDHWCMIAQNR